MNVAVIGSSEQLGSDLLEVLNKSGFATHAITHDDLEVSDFESCKNLLGLKLDVVINTAAFHKTDACEDDPLKAFAVNALGAYNVSRVCRELDAIHLYISTDYVFDGEKTIPYVETDSTNPLNVYGTSKVAGETLVKNYSPEHYIIRSSSLFGRAGASGKGGNFVETIVKKASNGEEIKVVDDVTMSPTNTLDLAEAISKVIEKRPPYGVYHVVNSGYCTWWEFARTISSTIDAKVDVQSISSKDFQSKAKRPKMSALSNSKLSSYGIRMRSWEEALNDYLHVKGYASVGERLG